jgi:hypothetical protein
MDFLLPLTIIGFLISIYEISESQKKRNLVFKFGFIDKVIFLILSLLVLALVILDIFWQGQTNSIIWVINNYNLTWSLTISVLALVVSAIIIIYFWVKLNSKNILLKERFANNLKDLLNNRKFAELTSDIEIYFKEIFSKNKSMKSISEDIVTNTQFITYLSENNLDLALKIMKIYSSSGGENLWNIVGRTLISDRNSRLFNELNSGVIKKGDLLYFLFKDTKQCQRWLVWKPVGDYVIEYIENQAKVNENKNNYYESNYDLVKVSSPIYQGIRFFDVMVKKSLEQNTPDHMWLYYLGYWTERICKNIKYTDNSSAEFKNMYEYYLYQIFDAYRNWITYIIRNDFTVPTGEEGPNIIENTINSYTFAMKDVATSKNVREDFKSYLREIYLNTYMELATSKPKNKFKPYVDFFNDKLSKSSELAPFLLFAVNNPMSRDIWSQGAHYSMNQDKSKILNNFKIMLKSLSSSRGKKK